MKIRLIRTVVLCFFVVVAPQMGFSQGLQVGVAKRIINPDPLLPVSGGVGIPRPVQEKQGDLFIHAAVFEENGERMALVVVDNLGWPSSLGEMTGEIFMEEILQLVRESDMGGK